MLNAFLDFVFPKSCVSCGEVGTYLCNNCQGKIAFLTEAICPMCERPAIDGVTHPGCQTRYSLDGLVSFYRYDGPVKAAIKRLKYKPYLVELARMLVNRVYEGGTLYKVPPFNNFIVVPVPLHPQRERERGFNQAALVGKAIAQQLSLEFKDNVLKRTRNTKPQVLLKEKDRRKNLTDAFAIDPSYQLLVTSYLLIDDVWTTGSTLRSCANVLKRAGAKKVWAMTVAR